MNKTVPSFGYCFSYMIQSLPYGNETVPFLILSSFLMLM
ncbi:hypothetical protein I656_01360 [Geobacillus sp. WSUCF1]|nr:hypothetical protein I656_01360 [Geobacillus sp. WSUCF1]